MSALSKMSLRPNGTPFSKVFLPGFVALPRLGQRRFSRKMAPCAHHRLALGNPREAALDHRLRSQLAVLNQPNQVRRG